MKLKHPYYAENPNLKLKIVTTHNGKLEYSVNCRKINNFYYIIGVDLMLVDGKYHLISTLTFDNERKTFVKDTKNLICGIIGHVEGKVEIGYFSPNIYNNCNVYLKGRGTYVCIDYKLLNEPYFVENIGEGNYFLTKEYTNFDISKLKSKRLIVNNKDKTYNIIDNKNLGNVIENYNNFQLSIEKDIKYLSNYIKGFTFGAEIETINGNLPEYLLNRYGVMICKDGSLLDGDGIYPPEYVTIPLSGAKGLQTIKDVAIEITKRSEINNKCSLHLHLGGFDIDKVFLISLFKLCYKIQNDVFKMFPGYKVNERKYANKQKSYCKKLAPILNNYISGTDFNLFINKAYKDFYGFLTGGLNLGRDFNFANKHNPWGKAKWDIDSRYYWINFTNFVFGKQKTVEFRLHSATTNPDKIINWLMMCIAIVKYAQNNTLKCINSDKISFEKDVLNVFKNNTNYSKILCENLVAYYKNRVAYFENDLKNEDFLSSKELLEDSTFTFNIAKIS